MLSCADILFLKNRSQKALNLVENGNFCFKPILLAFFVTIAMVTFKSMPRFYTSVILLIANQKKLVKSYIPFWL